jgi:hypothetical protein
MAAELVHLAVAASIKQDFVNHIAGLIAFAPRG